MKRVLLVTALLALLILNSCNTNSSKQTDSESANCTFASTIAPIIFKNCTPCHRPGQAGPFNLVTYADNKLYANQIKFVTQTHYMPPWPADVTYTHFIDERSLTEKEIAQIKTWVDGGCAAGDTSQLKTPTYPQGSVFGKPDLVLKMQQAIPIKGNGDDQFYIIKFPYQLKHDTFVSHFEFVPHQGKLAHHVNGHLISYEDVKKANVFAGKSYLQDKQNGLANFHKEMGLLNDNGTYPTLMLNVLYYLPGYTPVVYPKSIGGYSLKKKGVLLLKDMHYGPTAEDCVDSSTIHVFFGPKPIRPIQETQLGTFGIAPVEPKLFIKANTEKTFMSKWTSPTDLSVLSVNPRMHWLGKTFLAYGLTPQGDTIRLIKINRWDFTWQYYYSFKHPIKIPAGSTIYAFGTYDNTDKNLNNPFHPPKACEEIKNPLSMETSEEMFQFIFTYLNYQTGDEKIDLELHSTR
ncbi:MAG TPA: hypothetical protein VF411_06845 [Bacteroidia bacterium]